ncbi:MAG: thymidine phosphorylase [Spirochaetes bacterium]|nr:thymidine phosphorylase [Spirochaetota bacterium]
MNILEILRKKRDGKILSEKEMKFFIDSVSHKTIPDYQISAFLMAVFFQGLNFDETSLMTKYMVESGVKVDLSDIELPSCDKHSTGGVGDKISIPLAPIVSCFDIAVGMMSGRGLGHTGGTLDKLESIPGFNVNLSLEEFKEQIRALGVSMIGQTEQIAVADKYLYALRDATCTIESIPLITASIMSKKIAEGTKNLIIDLKVGSGAFMKDLDSARKLGEYLIEVGKINDINTRCVLTNMNYPIGKMIGNSLEIIESLELLKGNITEGDFYNLTVYLAAQMISITLKQDFNKSCKMVQNMIISGKPLKKFEQLVRWQNGNVDSIYDYNLLPSASIKRDITLKMLSQHQSGYISNMDAFLCGNAANYLGAGRFKKEDSIDHGAGIVINHKIGEFVNLEDSIFTLYTNNENSISIAIDCLKKAIEISESKPLLDELILENM